MATRVITFARQIGTDGEPVARECARRLGFRLLDRQVLQAAAAEAGVSPEALSDAEHKPSLMTRILDVLASEAAFPESSWHDSQSLAASPLVISRKYRMFIEDVVRNLYVEGNCIIVGHAGHIVLGGRPDVFRVLVTSSLDVRVKRLMRDLGIDEDEARRVAKSTDEDRLRYYEEFYAADWLSPSAYDLCINTGHLSTEQAAQIVEFAARL